MKTEEIILPDDPTAATPVKVDMWKSLDGFAYQDERTARYASATHQKCKCGKITRKHYTACDDCRLKDEVARYEAMPRAEWDGKALLYSQAADRFFSTLEDAEYEAEDGGTTLADLRLVICVPQYARLAEDHFVDELPEDCETPDEVAEAIEAFNKAVEGVVLAWYPGKFALSLPVEVTHA